MPKKPYARPYVVRIVYWFSNVKTYRFKTKKSALQFCYKKQSGLFVTSSSVTYHRQVIYPSKIGVSKGWL